MDREGEPGLQTQVQRTEPAVDEVEVEMGALDELTLNLQLSPLPVGPHGHAVTGFDALQDTDQPFFDAVGLGDLQRQVLLSVTTAGQIQQRPAGALRELLGRPNHPVREALGPDLEVLQQHALIGQEAIQPLGVGHCTLGDLCAAEWESVLRRNAALPMLLFSGKETPRPEGHGWPSVNDPRSVRNPNTKNKRDR
jgi:hypothetical protein